MVNNVNVFELKAYEIGCLKWFYNAVYNIPTLTKNYKYSNIEIKSPNTRAHRFHFVKSTF